MQKNEFNEMRYMIGEKIKQTFGNKISAISYYDIVEEPGFWAFKINFVAYRFFWVIFSYERGLIGFSIQISNEINLDITKSPEWYSKVDIDTYLQDVMKDIELRIPDKYLKAHGWM